MKHTIDIQPRFNDFDMFAHANNGAYFQYCDVAKLAFFTHLMDEGEFDPTVAELVIVHIECDFRQPLHFGDAVKVSTEVTAVGTTSVSLEQNVMAGDGRICAAVRTVLVRFNPQTGATEPIDDVWRARLASDK